MAHHITSQLCRRARDGAGDEWEEKWGEFYGAWGRVNKYADKWAKQGVNVWHEKWGESCDMVREKGDATGSPQASSLCAV